MAEHWILGFDIGGTKTAVIAGTVQGEVLARAEFASQPQRGFQAMWRDLVGHGHAMTRERGRPDAIGVSIGGPLDARRGIIFSPPNLPGWDDIPLKAMLEADFGVPAYVEHDAKACALAEWMFGAARGKRNVIFLTFGTGLGAGLILDGRLYRGARDGAGEVGHWRLADDGPFIYGKRGAWEGFSSGAGIPALAHYLFPERFGEHETAAEIIAQARAGDRQAAEVISASATALGRGIALLVDLLNPDSVVLGSLAVRAGDLFLPVVREIVKSEATSHAAAACVILPAALGDALGDVAALCAAVVQIA